MASNPPHAVEVDPETELQFVLSRNNDVNARVTMTLRHPGNTDEHLAFKVKTTQPRRYLVRPNQGLVAPGCSETVSILLVDKDKQSLLSTFDRLGQSGLDHSKDKFLVQSCAVSFEFSNKYAQEKSKAASQKGDAANAASKELAEALTSMWNALTSGSAQPVYNKKLHVRHSVLTTATATPAPIQPHETSLAQMENMTPEQMFAEVSSLRRKYDELVSFSVNLTAERDILNNTLEQAKRDLNREIASRGTARSMGGVPGVSGAKKSSFGMTLVQFLIVGMVAFYAGIKFAPNVGMLKDVPVVGETLVATVDETSTASEL